MDFVVLPLSERIGLRAVVYTEQYALPYGLRAGDAIVAATAVEAGLPLVTSNTKHYRPIAGLTVRQFKP